MAEQKEQPFGFPFTPYPIQVEFMRSLYDALQNKRIGIFESPTGTGKSLSIICGAMKWLKDHENEPLVPEKESNEVQTAAMATTTNTTMATPKAEEPDWVREFQQKKIAEKEKQKQDDHILKMTKQRERFKRLRDSESSVVEVKRPAKQRKLNETPQRQQQQSMGQSDDMEFLVKDYDSDAEDGDSLKAMLLRKYGFSDSDDDDGVNSQEDEEEEVSVRKIFYCSRTHSQLSQFVQELKRTVYGIDIKMTSLGSRKNLCINPSVSNLPTMNQINDKCLDLMKSESASTKSEKKEKETKESESNCSFYNHQFQPNLRDHILSLGRDIEEIGALGKKMRICPYYGSRSAVRSAELVVLPYNMLLHKQARESLGIDLRGNIVIFDEAHNIIDTVNNIYSVDLSASKISQANAQLTQYYTRYESRLKAKNKSYIQKILFVMKQLIKCLAPTETSVSASHSEDEALNSKMMKLNDFMFDTQIDNVNLFKLEKYFQKSEIVKKVNGFCSNFEVEVKITNKRKMTVGVSQEEFEKHRPALGLVESFLLALTNKDGDGRILVSKHPTELKKSSLKFLLLNAEVYFEEVLSQARAVILAGGTMQPFNDFTMQVVSPKIPSDRLKFLSCQHVVPDENLVAIVAQSGPSGVEFDFSYENRGNLKMLDELGQMLSNYVTIIPDGIVLFFSSYYMEEMIISRWKETGILDRINSKKKVFREPRNASGVDQVLKEYSEVIENNFVQHSAGTKQPIPKPKGALLSCVVGGKLSEGINFKDGLGRCVIMVGLPFPNSKDPVLVEKMAYISQKNGVGKPQLSQQYYENLCMKAVNQSIGRSIRHVNDYASILLVDARFKKPSIQSKLPQWISKRTTIATTFSEGFGAVSSFFRGKRPLQAELEAQRQKKSVST